MISVTEGNLITLTRLSLTKSIKPLIKLFNIVFPN